MEQKILVGTTDGFYEVGDSQRRQLAGHEVGALTTSDSSWWAILDRREVWRSNPNEAWTKVTSIETLKANCLLPSRAGLLVGTSDAYLFTLQDKTLEPVRSFEKVQGRADWYTPWGGPPDVRSMSVDPSGTVYVNVHVGGVARSSNGGKSWEPTIDMHADVHQVVFDPGSGQVFAASAYGLAVSNNGGESWRFDTEGLHGNYLRAVTAASGTVLVSASTGPSTKRAAVYRKPLDSAGSFERCQEGLPEWISDNINTFCLAASGSRVAFGTSEGIVFLSLDEGQSWNIVAEGLQPVRSVALA